MDQGTLAMWEDEVKAVEALRVTNIRVMDIYAARLLDRLAVENTQISASASASGSSADKQWMEYALLVEETQFIICK